MSLLKRLLPPIILVLTSILASPLTCQAQTGPSASITYDFLPHQDIDEPIRLEDGSIIDNAGVRLARFRATLTYTIVFSEGRTVLVNDLSYQLIDFEYRNWDYPLKRLHAASYTLMLQHRFSRKWSVWALGTPSMATDLKAEVSENDFNFQAATVIIRHFSERFSIGVGAVFATRFGSGKALPILAVDWNNGKNLMAKAILPASVEFWYRTCPRLDLGLLVSGDGNNFRGDPAIYRVIEPGLRYTMLTVGPALRINLSGDMRINVEGGLIGLHRFEFFDGDRETASYDLKPSQYLRVSAQYGG
ncbi:MAG: hypothetical protein JSV52_01645 [Candidatus Zixiibacteriota bacterium]|nr:MAG: hypothetical protein JSV52_01645 [candidate division Zixibacteria bacterium]